MIKGFFFDLDGTLVNTYKADFLAYRDAISEVLGITISESDFNTTHGEEMRKKLVKLAPNTTEDNILKIAENKKRYYRQHLDETIPNEELIVFLAHFSVHHAMVLVTTAKRENALGVLDKHNLTKYFSHMIFGEDVSKAKPDPEAYLKALKISGLKPEEVIVFEDSKSGLDAAEAAGLAAVYVRKFSL